MLLSYSESLADLHFRLALLPLAKLSQQRLLERRPLQCPARHPITLRCALKARDGVVEAFGDVEEPDHVPSRALHLFGGIFGGVVVW